MDHFQWLNRMTDRAVLGAAGALMSASQDATAPGARTLTRALGTAPEPPGTLGALAWKALAARLAHQLRDALEDEVAEEFLETLLRLMQITLLVDPAYRKNVGGFDARYEFESADGGVALVAVFEDGRLHVREGRVAAPDLRVRFATGRALLQVLLSRPQPDVLLAMLHGQVQTEGNLNYLYRLAFLARRLQRAFGLV